jgi:hypothetical protein
LPRSTALPGDNLKQAEYKVSDHRSCRVINVVKQTNTEWPDMCDVKLKCYLHDPQEWTNSEKTTSQMYQIMAKVAASLTQEKQ